VLNRAANAAKQAGVSCDTIQVENEQPYKAIIATAADRGCDLIVMASHGRCLLWANSGFMHRSNSISIRSLRRLPQATSASRGPRGGAVAEPISA